MNPTLKGVRYQGCLDGRGFRYAPWPFKKMHPVTPELNSPEPSEYERKLLANGQAQLLDIVENWRRKDIDLKKDYCQAKLRVVLLQEELDATAKSDTDRRRQLQFEFNQAQLRQQAAHDVRDRDHKAMLASVEALEAEVIDLVREYRAANQKARRASGTILAFQTSPKEITVDLKLTEINWLCDFENDKSKRS